jgi:hypothetical protein
MPYRPYTQEAPDEQPRRNVLHPQMTEMLIKHQQKEEGFPTSILLAIKFMDMCHTQMVWVDKGGPEEVDLFRSELSIPAAEGAYRNACGAVSRYFSQQFPLKEEHGKAEEPNYIVLRAA